MRFFKLFSQYALANFISKGFGFIFLPFFAHYLSAAEYGSLSIFTNSVYFLSPFMSMGIPEMLTVSYRSSNKEDMDKLISTSIFFTSIILFFLVVLIIATQNQLVSILKLPLQGIFFIPFLCFFSCMIDLVLVIFRNEENSKSFGVLSITRVVGELILSFALIKYFAFGWEGRMYAMIIAGLICTVYTIYFFLRIRKIRFKLSASLFKRIFSFGIPLVPFAFMIFMLSNADKYFINLYMTNTETGIYSLSFQFGLIINVLTASFLIPFYPYLYKLLDANLKKTIIRNCLYFLGLLVIFVFFIMLFCFSPLFPKLVSNKFLEARNYILPMCISQVFWAAFVMLLGYIYYTNKNKVLYLVSSVTIFTVLVSNYLVSNKFPTLLHYSINSMFNYFIPLLILTVYIYLNLRNNLFLRSN